MTDDELRAALRALKRLSDKREIEANEAKYLGTRERKLGQSSGILWAVNFLKRLLEGNHVA